MKKHLILPFLSFYFVSCGHQTSVDVEKQEASSNLDGKLLMEKNCYSCHNTQGTDNMLAPPMQRVKDHYWDEDISKEEFVSAIVQWCENPMEENSIMPGARRKFGLMPKQEFDEKEVEAIAEYLFENNIDNSSCSNDDSGCSNCGTNCSHEY
ncbi:MAG: c-type cytochrome [Bacteroidetes bacterium]|nr:MAG: c-type cytochrome [Bacteroidota bacterium]